MAAPALADYTYQYKDNGLLLNGGAAIPFIDVLSVTGLDMPEAAVREEDIDGEHGGIVISRYAKSRTIIVDGMIYASSNNLYGYIDTVKRNFMISDYAFPFHFKLPGAMQKYALCKVAKCNIPNNRENSFGVAQMQLQLIAADPRLYADKDTYIKVSGESNTITNDGSVESYPTIRVTGAYSSLTLHQTAPYNRKVVFNYAATSSDVTDIDMKNRTIRVNGAIRTSAVTENDWWAIEPGSNTYTIIGATSATTARSAWL